MRKRPYNHDKKGEANPMDRYDAIIIGAGQAGVPLSTALARAGRNTAMVEAKYLGGTCINYGCTPTKSMVGSAEVAYLAGRAAEYGVRDGPVSVDLAKVRQRKNEIVERFRTGIRNRLDSAGVKTIRGLASFSGAKTLEVQLNDGGTR